MTKTPKLLTVCLAVAVVCTGCAGNAGTNPPAGTAGMPQPMGADAPPAADGIAGHYAGSISQKGTAVGTVKMDLSQSGSAGGGSATLKIGALPKLSAAVSLNVATTGSTGTLVVIPTKSVPACSFAISKAFYNPKNLMLTGKLSAFQGCTGQAFSFAAKEICYYRVGRVKREDGMPRTLPKSC
jgi:hypothetical protein